MASSDRWVPVQGYEIMYVDGITYIGVKGGRHYKQNVTIEQIPLVPICRVMSRGYYTVDDSAHKILAALQATIEPEDS
jgi:hypothetical protein